jgi:hypothetical protein
VVAYAVMTCEAVIIWARLFSILFLSVCIF